jgi:hypothetical protein
MVHEPLAAASARLVNTAGSELYEPFHEVLAASERGRAFLTEHARRSRVAETEVLLAALARIEASVAANGSAQSHAIRPELATLIATIRSARPDIESCNLPTRAARLAALLDLLEMRLVALSGPLPARPDGPADGQRGRLAVVPPPREPELPIPSPAAEQPPAIALAAQPADLAAQPVSRRSTVGADTASESPARGENRVAVAISDLMQTPAPAPAVKPVEPPVDDARLWALSDAKLAPPPPDPLAALMLLSEDERLALFT